MSNIAFSTSYVLYVHGKIQVVVVDKLDYCANLRNFERVASYLNFKFIKGDICSSDLISHLLREEEIDTKK